MGADQAATVKANLEGKLTPRQDCLLAPELQWQSRGKLPYLTGVVHTAGEPVDGVLSDLIFKLGKSQINPRQQSRLCFVW